MLTEFDGAGTHQADHAVFGGDVVTGVRVAFEAAPELVKMIDPP